ncbi:flavin-containing monooxygenase [Actinomycetospora termitidis]|uniref:NAD(P)/FAD-dependent oxidoreductase n=1 Tax=Actinomycetospora termitidis TaxID=3053470 RepID=A0ABT7MDD7_9PSEU|nr:NAD(P)/FAD-dependent oxidoreductase [Actinomycetospora sp. Odt1-22]MDL5157393.1 NAD(P)/FAD-dependent oxidoreductase [Actinomycetospora sp. Odt1-22]
MSVPSPRPATVTTVDALVVGAGLAGLYMLHRLRGLGLDTVVVEAGDGVGGTWYWNRYPGARCDVESLEYSYSFSTELEQEWEWTEKYPTQPEILRYVEHVADRFGLRDGVRLSTSVTAAHWDDARGRWHVTTDAGDAYDAEQLVMATGCLSMAKTPEVPGTDSFAGRTFHTGHWPHEKVDFTGRRVAVIGTGSSGIQTIPMIAEEAAELTVFQRTPNFSMPASNRPLDPADQAERKRTYREHRQAARTSGFGVPVEAATQSALEVSDAERDARYEAAWGVNLVGLLSSYTDTIVDRAANDTAAEFVRRKIRETVTDPQVAETLSPRDHPFGTKRPCLDTNYYATYNRDHVHLVDLKATPLAEITPRGVRTSEREYEVDDLVFATGFDAMTGALLAIDVVGRDGATLRERWADGPTTNLGLQVAGFPNLWMITGPGSPSVLSNMMVSIEQHVDFVADCLAYAHDRGETVVESTPEAETEWTEHVRVVGEATLYPQANSWYMGSNVPGKPRRFMAYIGGVGAYREHCDDLAARGYPGFAFSTPRAVPAPA